MKRLAFNGGEISPNMALRSDMDTYTRACSTLLNWQVHPTGGITRRTGMQPIASAINGTSRLLPYRYSAELSYLIELSTTQLIVRDTAGQPLHTFTSDNSWGYDNLQTITYLQLNSILLIASPECQLMQLKLNPDYTWNFTPFNFKTPPWHSIDSRDYPISIAPTQNYYTITYHPDEHPDETSPDPGDLLRISYYTPRQTAYATASQLLAENWTTYTSTDTGITAASSFSPGHHIAVGTEPVYEHFVCTKDFNGANDFTNNCTSPANYPDNFLRAENSTGYESVTPIPALSASANYKKGNLIKLSSGYWQLYTCIRPFSTEDFVQGMTSPADYPSHFIHGVPIGNPLTCRGTWKFHCSGTWYGSYEVRRSYTTPDLTALWSTLGESLSLIGSPSNNLLSGNEEAEECHLRLFLTSIRHAGADIAACWPPDESGNQLVVSPYKHNMHLTVLADGTLQDTSPIVLPLTSKLTSDDWSWCAFNGRYGYPSLVELHESRLILAATPLQPQTLWLSRTDDIDNFATGSTDDAALSLTMTTKTQAPICWLTSRGSTIQIGTEDGEWVLSSTAGSAITPNTARISNHGRIGSAHIPAVTAADRLLYCERGSGRIYQFTYDYSQDAYISQDLTIFADHIASQGGGITGGTLLTKPYCVAIFTLADGTLALMTYNTHHNVNAWHRWQTKGKVESVCALPNGNNADNLYLITNRGTYRTIELLNPETPYVDGTDQYPYTSTVETTAFTLPDTNEPKRHQTQLKIFITTPTPASAITARTASTNYSAIAHSGTITPGWLKICTLSGWNDRPLLGLRIEGPYPAEILAMQTE